MLIIGFDGSSIHSKSPVSQWLESDGLGGVILFDYDLPQARPGKNIINQDQVKRLTRELVAAALESPAMPDNLPLLIAVDCEGGVVDRLKKLYEHDPCVSPRQFASLSTEEQALEAQKMALRLRALGFNLNFAPVVDLDLNQDQGIIGKLDRSYSSDPQQVASVAQQFVTVLAQQGIGYCYKHFPGHGSALGDTHEGFVDVSDTFQPSELTPYRLLLQTKNIPMMIMTAHVINRQLDPAGLPATLSYPILTGLLREKMGFDGLIISDDLQMQAISQHYSLTDSLRMTINAGADMMIFGNQLGQHTATEIIDLIENLVSQQAIDPLRIQQAYQRIRRYKGLLMTDAND